MGPTEALWGACQKGSFGAKDAGSTRVGESGKQSNGSERVWRRGESQEAATERG